MMSGDLPVMSDADAMAKQRAKEAELAGGGTMLASGSTKRKADQVLLYMRVGLSLCLCLSRRAVAGGSGGALKHPQLLLLPLLLCEMFELVRLALTALLSLGKDAS